MATSNATVANMHRAAVSLPRSVRGILSAPMVLAGIDGVTAIRQLDNEPD
jgi:putative Mg2+ transporter-C (MgtC) family protein